MIEETIKYLLSFTCIELIEPYKIIDTDVVVGNNEIVIPEFPDVDIDGFLPLYFNSFNGSITNLSVIKLIHFL